MIYFFLLSSSLFAFRPKSLYNWTKVTNIGRNRPLKSADAEDLAKAKSFMQGFLAMYDKFLKMM